VVIEQLIAARGGRERSVAETAIALAERDHDVTVLCQAGALDAAGVEVLDLGRHGPNRVIQAARFARDVRDVAGRERYDIVQATLPIPGCNVYQPRGGTIPGLIAAKARHAGPIRGAVRKALAPFNAARRQQRRWERQVVADRDVLCLPVSELVGEELAVYYGRRDNVRVVFNGVTVPPADGTTRDAWRAEWRRRWELDDDATAFVTVAQNFAMKGVAEAIDAFAAFAQAPGARATKYVVVGADADAAGPYRRRAERRGVAERVIFQQAVPDVFPIYSAADVIVLLSWHDACSRVILEATRWTVPSITTVYNGAAEALAGGAGVVVRSPRDRRAVAAAMADLTDPRRRADRADACRQAAGRLGMDRHVDELLAAYEDFLAARR